METLQCLKAGLGMGRWGLSVCLLLGDWLAGWAPSHTAQPEEPRNSQGSYFACLSFTFLIQ